MFINKVSTLNESDSQAEKQCRQAMADAGFAFGNPPVSFHWSQLVNPLGNKQAAIDAYLALIEQEPENQSALEGLSFLYQTLGNHDQARHCRRQQCLSESKQYDIAESDIPAVVDFMLAKTGDAEAPGRVPAEFLRAHFNRYSDIFDSQLVGNLKYVGAIKAKQTLLSDPTFITDDSTLLDLGCGTGLVAEQLQGNIKQIVGVDISDDMLTKAKNKSVYQQLYHEDIFSFLEQHKKTYQIITAMDVLIYIGKLDKLFQLVNTKLVSGGRFLFSIELNSTVSNCLRNTGRYQHSKEYVLDCAKDAALNMMSCEEFDIRNEQNEPVKSMIFCLEKNDN